MLRRPAAAPVAAGRGWLKSGEVDTDTLLGWPWAYIQGRFWDEDVELIGKVLEVKMKDSGRELTMTASGTPTESLLKALTGIPSRQLRVHLCGDPCEALVWDEAYVHCSQLQEAQRAEIGWSQNLEAAGGREEEDELHQLRKSVEELRGKGKGVGGPVTKERKRSRSPGTSGDEEAKKKKKRRKKDALKIQGKKGLESLFSSTGLDPKPEIRRRVKRKARKVARRSRNKKRGSSSSGSESSSSSSRESVGVEDKDLFEPATPTQRVWKVCPGALTMAMIAEAKEALLTQMGTASEPMEGAVPAQILTPSMSGPVARESHHWGLLLDLLLSGQVAAAADLAAQRLKALEGHAKGMKPELLRQLELVAQEKPSLASTTEIMKAGRQANEEVKVLQKASSRDTSEKGKGQWRDWKDRFEKGEKSGKFDKGKKGKSEGKKKAA